MLDAGYWMLVSRFEFRVQALTNAISAIICEFICGNPREMYLNFPRGKIFLADLPTCGRQAQKTKQIPAD